MLVDKGVRFVEESLSRARRELLTPGRGPACLGNVVCTTRL